MRLQSLEDEIAIEGIIRRLPENRHAPIAALGHVVRNVGNDDPGEAGHTNV